jgi:hypothetical protein
MKKVAKKSVITEDTIRIKAFEIHKRDHVDDPRRNWFQAIKELKTL